MDDIDLEWVLIDNVNENQNIEVENQSNKDEKEKKIVKNPVNKNSNASENCNDYNENKSKFDESTQVKENQVREDDEKIVKKNSFKESANSSTSTLISIPSSTPLEKNNISKNKETSDMEDLKNNEINENEVVLKYFNSFIEMLSSQSQLAENELEKVLKSNEVDDKFNLISNLISKSMSEKEELKKMKNQFEKTKKDLEKATNKLATDTKCIETLTNEKIQLQKVNDKLKIQLEDYQQKITNIQLANTNNLQNLTTENELLKKNYEKMQNQYEECKEKANIEIEKLNNKIREEEEEKKAIQEKLDNFKVSLSEMEKNNEKTNTSNIKLHQHLPNEEEEDNDKILKLKFNNFKESLNETTKIFKTKGKNPEDTKNLSIINNLFDKITNIIPKIQNQIDKKCSLICSDLCSYESSKGEIFYDSNDSIKIVQLSCGHYFHNECLKSNLAIYTNSYIKEITPNTVIRCPICYKDVNIL